MLITKSFLLITYFLIQVAVLAAPIPHNAREISFNDSELFSRARKKKGTIFSMYTWSITDYFNCTERGTSEDKDPTYKPSRGKH